MNFNLKNKNLDSRLRGNDKILISIPRPAAVLFPCES
jgi:hypothetical protein